MIIDQIAKLFCINCDYVAAQTRRRLCGIRQIILLLWLKYVAGRFV
jgi:hypothetical protein